MVGLIQPMGDMPASKTLNSQMMEKEKRSSPSDPLQHIVKIFEKHPTTSV